MTELMSLAAIARALHLSDQTRYTYRRRDKAFPAPYAYVIKGRIALFRLDDINAYLFHHQAQPLPKHHVSNLSTLNNDQLRQLFIQGAFLPEAQRRDLEQRKQQAGLKRPFTHRIHVVGIYGD